MQSLTHHNHGKKASAKKDAAMRLSEHFYLWELVPPTTYAKYRENSIWFIDLRVITILELIRKVTNQRITINDWYWNGSYKYSGYRPPDCRVGSWESQHRFGRGFDIKIDKFTIQEVHDLLQNSEADFLRSGLTAIEKIELTPTWTHIDLRYTDLSEFLFIGK